jgi:glycogen debranching enzyme
MSLLSNAEAVLRANWAGSSTVPSRRQYPHQWGWDAAFIAIGWSWIDAGRAMQELESILRGQWADGRVPHIVFNPAVPEDAYFPGPAFWASGDAPGGPTGVATSGLTQPPLHARAALEVARRAGDRADAFLRRVFPRLAAQHAYLAGRRDAGGGGLAAIVHPWESGLDDSPAWDEPLAAVELPPGGVAPYVRRDREHVDPSERPSDAAYDRFVHLARAYRDGGYADDGRGAFLVEDPLFNAIWLWSTHALAELAELVGEDGGPYRDAAAAIHAGLMERLWDPGRARFMARDLRAGRLVDRRTVGALAPLLDPDLPAAPTRALADELASPHFHSGAGIGVASYDLRAPDADARRYWRGPVWTNLNWLLARGLRGHGLHADADALDATTLELVAGAGMREYFDPSTGAGRGSTGFSWTAAVVVDLLRSVPVVQRRVIPPGFR